jgi:hypothetical protein
MVSERSYPGTDFRDKGRAVLPHSVAQLLILKFRQWRLLPRSTQNKHATYAGFKKRFIVLIFLPPAWVTTIQIINEDYACAVCKE